MKKLGISNLMPVIMLVVEAGNVGDQIGHKKGAERYLLVMKMIDEVTALSSVDFSKVKAEFKDIDDTERVSILAQVKTKLDLIDDDLEAVIEESLSIIEDAYSIFNRSMVLVKKFKKAE